MPKFSLKFFGTKTGHITLWVVGGLVLFYIAYRYIGGVGGGTTVAVSNTGPSDAEVSAEAAQNLATIQANAGVNATQIQNDAATAQAAIAAQVANNQIQEQGNEAALGAGVANNTITAELQGLVSSNQTSIAQSTIASNTILAQGTQQNDLLLGEINTQASEFNNQLDQQTNLALISAASSAKKGKKGTPDSIKLAFAGAISGITTSTPAISNNVNSNGSSVAVGGTTLH